MANRRKAGEILKGAQHVDKKLSEAVVNFFMGPKGKERTYGGNGAVQAAAGTAATYLGGTPLSARGLEETAPGAAYTSAVARYGAPLLAAGVGGAVVGGTTNAIFGGPEDGQQPGQLDLGQLTVHSLVGGAVPSVGLALNNMYREGVGLNPYTPGRGKVAAVSAAGAGIGALANALGQVIF